MKTGIYRIRNVVNDKVYIGSAHDIKKRWRDHKWHLKENKHHNPHLQSSYNQYGFKNFEFSIELECDSTQLLIEEERLIGEYDSRNNQYGYNINEPREIYTGRTVSSKTRKIHAERMSGENNPMFGKRGSKHPKHGYNLSDKQKKILSEWAKKRKGSRANASKLTENDVILIRKKYSERKHTQQNLSKMFGVSQNQISSIVNRKSWTHI